MRRRWIFVGLLACAFTLAAGFGLLMRDKEPRYKGKSLCEWILIFETNQPHQQAPADPRRLQEAGDAVRHIGTNALPFLLNWLDRTGPGWRGSAAVVLDKLGGPSGPRLVRLLGDELFKGLTRSERTAYIGFGILGSNAVPTIPELLRRVEKEDSERALTALQFMGGAGVQPLMYVITNKACSATLRTDAIGRCNAMGFEARESVPAVVAAMEDADEGVREAATNAVRRLGTWWLQDHPWNQWPSPANVEDGRR